MVWPKEAQVLSLKTLKEAFSKYTYLPMLPDLLTLKTCVVEGVRQGLFGYGLGDGKDDRFEVVHFKVPLATDALDFGDSAWLLRPDLAKRLIQGMQNVEVPPVPLVPPTPGATDGEGRQISPPLTTPSTSYRTVVVEGDLDWKKWADFYDGVIKPLIQAGATVLVHVRTEASSSAGVPRNVVDITVQENISQRGLSVKVLSEADNKK